MFTVLVFTDGLSIVTQFSLKFIKCLTRSYNLVKAKWTNTLMKHKNLDHAWKKKHTHTHMILCQVRQTAIDILADSSNSSSQHHELELYQSWFLPLQNCHGQ